MSRSFEILGRIHDVEIIAVGKSLLAEEWLRAEFGSGRWRKMKGFATVRLPNGRVVDGELHWYEAHGKGRVDMKLKREL
jgi:hypothetical protein